MRRLVIAGALALAGGTTLALPAVTRRGPSPVAAMGLGVAIDA
jgi:hypothetical protein